MQTQCPDCGAAFRVAPAQLARRRGWVRCGRCLTAFDGLARLSDEPANARVVHLEVPHPTGPASAPDPTPSADPAPSPGTTLRADAEARSIHGVTRAFGRIASVLVVLVLVLGLMLQWATLVRRPLTAWWPSSALLLEQICAASACPPPDNAVAARVPRPYRIETQMLRPDPRAGDAVELHLTFRHLAPWALPEPVWRLDLTDETGALRQRRLLPEHPPDARWAWVAPEELRYRQVRLTLGGRRPRAVAVEPF